MSVHRRSRRGLCSADDAPWPCPTQQLADARAQLAAADALASLVEAAQRALDGPMVEWGRALLAAFKGLQAYREARGPAPTPVTPT